MASPILQQPLTLGADIVVESLTKSIGGHSDVIGGVIALSNLKIFKRLRNHQITFGGVLSPFDCFLLLRSLKTLELRVEKQQENTNKIRLFLKKHQQIQQVFSPQKHIFNTQMKGQGFIISFIIKGDSQRANRFIKELKLITIGHSFGGVETVIQQPVTMMDLSSIQKQKLKETFFRLSVGLEDASDILTDLNQALK
jgi:cystathionine beta-lyase/cystathionine gamma-synthase